MKKYFLFLMAIYFALPEAIAAQTFAVPTPEPITQTTWRQVRSLSGIATQDGMTTPALYVFFDPNCPYSTKLWKRPVNGKTFGEVPAVWIPVTYLVASSLGKGAALVRYNSKQELARNFRDANIEYRQGAVIAVEPSAAERLALGRSKAVWLKLGGATPMLVYRDQSGAVKSYMGGPPEDQTADFVAKLAPSNLGFFLDK
jgi:thiol:disulfide interchange protein DsbG